MLAMAGNHSGGPQGDSDLIRRHSASNVDARAENASYALPIIETYAWPHANDDTNFVTPQLGGACAKI